MSPSACFYCIASKPAPGFSEVKQVLPAGSPQPQEHPGTQTHASTLSLSSFPQELGRTGGNKSGWMAPTACNPLQLSATAVTHTFPTRVVKSLLLLQCIKNNAGSGERAETHCREDCVFWCPSDCAGLRASLSSLAAKIWKAASCVASQK